MNTYKIKIGWTVISVAVLLYLVLGWHIGKIKYDMWFGLNGWASLKTGEIANSRGESFNRKILFPVIHMNVINKVGAEKLRNGEGDMPFILRNLQQKNSAPISYLVLYTVIGPIFSLIFFVLGWLILDGVLLTVFIVFESVILLWNALSLAFLALL